MPYSPKTTENYFDARNLQNAEKRRRDIAAELLCYVEMLSDAAKRLQEPGLDADEYRLYVVETIEAVKQRIDSTLLKAKRNLPYVAAKVLVNKIV